MGSPLKTENASIKSLHIQEWRQDENGLTVWGDLHALDTELLEDEVRAMLMSLTLRKIYSEQFYRCSAESNGADLVQQMFETEQGSTLLINAMSEYNHQLSEGENGYVFVLKYDGLQLAGEEIEGIQVFTCSAKESLIQLKYEQKELGVVHGFNINKLQFNLLIMNTDVDRGYKIFMPGAMPRRGVGEILAQRLLMLELAENEFVHTKQMIKLCHDFSKEVLYKSNSEEPKRKIEFLQQSARFFEDEAQFDLDVFKQEALAEPMLIDAFEEYKTKYEEKKQVEIPDRFDISAQAFNQSKKYVRSVIKLDKNFHIYVHSKPEYIERGIDEARNLKFYKLYYEEES
jgi:hypothetical protein